MSHSLYVHIPFCRHRCAYCDFNTYAGQGERMPEYVSALQAEIRVLAASAPGRLPAGTVFFGGGTPSLLGIEDFRQVLQTVDDHFDLADPASLETSLEANPGTLTLAYLRDLRLLGFNRLSLGVQSFHPEELRLLERIHDPLDVYAAVRWARRAGFENLNLDLIFGLPEQPLGRWQATVKQALDLDPEHLSLYALTVEDGTPFGRWAARGRLPLPDPDLAAEMYEWAGEYLEGRGYHQYEISNWARPGRECRHNLQYWRNQPYLGFGAGAHGYANGMRVANVLRIKTYIERCRNRKAGPFPISPATVASRVISRAEEMSETMLTGLRLVAEGVSAEGFRRRFGRALMAVFGKEIDELLGLNLLEWAPAAVDGEGSGAGDRILRLTSAARIIANQVFIRFVS
ncbi:MAG: radical SAM family heme chaperone HemW [Chloroflexota bacterium]